VRIAAERTLLEEDYKRLRHNFELAAGLYQAGIEAFKRDNPGIRINLDNRLFDIMRQERVEAYKAENGVVFVDAFTERTIEIPIMDDRSKRLLTIFAVQLKRFIEKYPKLADEMDIRVTEFLQREIIDTINVD
jgi:hypothetical protein